MLLTFYVPFIIDTKSRVQGDTLYLISLVESNLPSTLRLESCWLEEPGSLEPLLPFQPSSLVPKQKFSCVWKMEREGGGEFPKSSVVCLEYRLPGSGESYSYRSLVEVAPAGPHFSVTLECLTPHPQEGATCEFQVSIATPPAERKCWRLLYGVATQRGEWAVCGYKRRQIDLADTASFKIQLLALSRGKLEFPKVLLWEYRDPQLQTVGNSRDLLYITTPQGGGGLTPLGAVESDPLSGTRSPLRKRSTSTLPRAEKLDYSGGRERVKPVNSIVLNTLTRDSLTEIPPHRMCSYNSLSVVEVAPA